MSAQLLLSPTLSRLDTFPPTLRNNTNERRSSNNSMSLSDDELYDFSAFTAASAAPATFSPQFADSFGLAGSSSAIGGASSSRESSPLGYNTPSDHVLTPSSLNMSMNLAGNDMFMAENMGAMNSPHVNSDTSALFESLFPNASKSMGPSDLGLMAAGDDSQNQLMWNGETFANPFSAAGQRNLDETDLSSLFNAPFASHGSGSSTFLDTITESNQENEGESQNVSENMVNSLAPELLLMRSGNSVSNDQQQVSVDPSLVLQQQTSSSPTSSSTPLIQPQQQNVNSSKLTFTYPNPTVRPAHVKGVSTPAAQLTQPHRRVGGNGRTVSGQSSSTIENDAASLSDVDDDGEEDDDEMDEDDDDDDSHSVASSSLRVFKRASAARKNGMSQPPRRSVSNIVQSSSASGGITKSGAKLGGTPSAGGKRVTSAVVAIEGKDPNDLDDWRPTPEEYKKLSSKEKRQLRNKISARNFRVRRKEYITTLEGHISDRDALIDAIRAELGASKMENDELRKEVDALKKAMLGEVVEPAEVKKAASVLSASASVNALPKTSASPVLKPTMVSKPVTVLPSPSVIKPNLRKDINPTASPGARRSSSTNASAFWGGRTASSPFGMGGGYTPVHYTQIPDLVSAALDKENVAPLPEQEPAKRSELGMTGLLSGKTSGWWSNWSGANQENINPLMNNLPSTNVTPSSHPDDVEDLAPMIATPEKEKEMDSGLAKMSKMEAFMELNPFTIKSAEEYRMHLWAHLAASRLQQHHQFSQLQAQFGPESRAIAAKKDTTMEDRFAQPDYYYQQQQQQGNNGGWGSPLSVSSPSSPSSSSNFLLSSPAMSHASSSAGSSSSSQNGSLLSQLRPAFFGTSSHASSSSSLPSSSSSNPRTTLAAMLAGKHTLPMPSSSTSYSSSSTSNFSAPPPSAAAAAFAASALASHTFMSRFRDVVSDAFSCSPSSSGRATGAWDADKVRRVMEGKAVLRVVDLPASASSTSPVGLRKSASLEDAMKNMSL